MAFLVVAGLIALGYIIGGLITGVLTSEKFDEREVFGAKLYDFFIGIFYFGSVFSAPLSGNLALFIIMAGILMYALYGGFAAHKLRPKKPEDKVVSKWYPGYP